MSEIEKRQDGEANLLLNLFVFAYILVITAVIRFPYFFPAVISWDESTQIIMGQSILDGQLPYIDLWDNKPPLSFLAYGLFILFLGKSIVAVRLAGAICVVTTAYLIYIVARNTWNNRSGIISATIFIIFTSIMRSGQATMTEIVAIVPLIASMTILITQKGTPTHLFVAGFLLGVSTFIRTNLAFVSFFVTLAILVNLTLEKNKSILYQMIAFILGGVAVVTLVVLPYLFTGNLQIFFDSVFLAPLVYSNSQYSMLEVTKYLIKVGFGYSNIILWLGFLAGIAWATKEGLISSYKKRKCLIILSVFFIGTSFSIMKSGNADEHYIIQIIPFMALLSGAIIDALLSSKFRYFIVTVLLFGLYIPAKTVIYPYRKIMKNILVNNYFP